MRTLELVSLTNLTGQVISHCTLEIMLVLTHFTASTIGYAFHV